MYCGLRRKFPEVVFFKIFFQKLIAGSPTTTNAGTNKPAKNTFSVVTRVARFFSVQHTKTGKKYTK
jgi:hypothetical protein